MNLRKDHFLIILNTLELVVVQLCKQLRAGLLRPVLNALYVCFGRHAMIAVATFSNFV